MLLARRQRREKRRILAKGIRSPISVNEHGQDIGLGLRNIAIIWGESAT